MKRADVVIIGGGIVGLATAYHVTRQSPRRKVIILEKEAGLAQHQSGRNSGVLHSGIYYRPGSLKAINCREGNLAMQAFCEEQGIPYELCGKVIVAVDEAELPLLDRIYERGQANGVRCRVVDAGELRELEPHVNGIRALHVSTAGIVDYRLACERLADQVREREGEVLTGAKVHGIQRNGTGCVVQSTLGEVRAHVVVNCAGLYSDHMTRLSGEKPKAMIVPFRGEYFKLKPGSRHLCRNLIYPVPHPDFPFLGVHFTRTIDGEVECGPNAVLAFAREGYRKRDLHFGELLESLCYPGFHRLAAKYWKTGLAEMWRSVNKSAFVRALRRLVPEVRADDLAPAPSGVRAQALTPDGKLVDDFLIQETDRVIHVNNAPSPAATASLNIGKLIAARVARHLT